MKEEKTMPKQHQTEQPGKEESMTPKPGSAMKDYKGSGRLASKVAIVTGGDSGIGRAVAIAFAREGADVAIVYLNEHGDAEETQRLVEREKRRCLTLDGDVGSPAFCRQAVEQVVGAFGRLNI